jgi:hypothetical protein
LRSDWQTGSPQASSTGEPRAAVADAAVQAQFALFELAQGSVHGELARRAEELERRRDGLLLAMALLGSIALALLVSLSRRLRAGLLPTPPAGAAEAAAAEPSAGGSRAEARRVLQRLRVPAPGQSEAPADAVRPNPLPTIPPES